MMQAVASQTLYTTILFARVSRYMLMVTVNILPCSGVDCRFEQYQLKVLYGGETFALTNGEYRCGEHAYTRYHIDAMHKPCIVVHNAFMTLLIIASAIFICVFSLLETCHVCPPHCLLQLRMLCDPACFTLTCHLVQTVSRALVSLNHVFHASLQPTGMTFS